MSKLSRATLGIDGNCGYAMLGGNIQEGEAEFVEIDSDLNDDPNRYHSSDWRDAANKASRQALDALRKRLGRTEKNDSWITFAFEKSHPNYVN